MWWCCWRENNKNVVAVVVVVEGKQWKCGGGGIQFQHKNKAITFLLFSLRHHHHHRHHIFIVFPSPPLPPLFYCFPSSTTATFPLFSLHHHHHRHISIVFPPPPPPRFYCFPCRIIYYSSKQNGKNGFVIVSQRINFHSFSFQIAVYLTIFFCYCVLIKFLKRYLSCGFIASHY